MRVAVFSDVHGNVRALEAVLAEIEARGPFEAVVNGGDLVYGGPRPREALELLMRGGYPTVLGNTDVWIAGMEPGGGATVAWARRQLEPQHEAFIRGLPRTHRIEPPGGPPLLVVHATPTSLSDLIAPDAPEEMVAKVFEQARARTVVYGHIHKACVRDGGGGLIVTTGAVAFPFDGIPTTSVAILCLDAGRWHGETVAGGYSAQ